MKLKVKKGPWVYQLWLPRDVDVNLIQDRLVNFFIFLKFWFDDFFQQIVTEPYDCACCESGASQCGYPMHNKCKYDSDETGEGCPGNNNYKTDSGANIRHFSDFVPFCHILAPRYTLLYRKTDFGANIRHFSD